MLVFFHLHLEFLIIPIAKTTNLKQNYLTNIISVLPRKKRKKCVCHFFPVRLLRLFSAHVSALCAVSGPALETFVGDDVNTLLILNLLSDTEYSVQVIASYTTGSSQPLTTKGKTRESIHSTPTAHHYFAAPSHQIH